MDLAKYKIPMGELPIEIQQTLKKNIKDSEFLGFKNAAQMHKKNVFSNGIYRNRNKEILITCVTEMPEVSPRMIDWWFGWHLNESERYQLWHPQAHVSACLKQDNSQFKTDKEKYLHMNSYVKEYIGTELNHLCISFVEPEDFGFSSLNNNKETAICAHVRDMSNNISIASITHFVNQTQQGSVMQSSFWLGMNPEHTNSILTLLIRPLLESRLIKNLMITDGLAKALLTHCAEEMNHLCKFLPTLFQEVTDRS